MGDFITFSTWELKDLIPEGEPLTKRGLKRYLKGVTELEENYLEAQTVIKRLIKNRFKGEIKHKITKDRVQILIQPKYTNVTGEIEKVIHILFTFIKEKLWQKH